MQKQRSGKALSLLIVIVWIGVIGGGVFAYVKYQEKIAKAAKEEAERLEAESAPERPKLKGLQVPGLTIPEGAELNVKRSKPFQFVFSDIASTNSKTAPPASIEYPSEPQTDETYSKLDEQLMLKGVEHFRKTHANNSQATEVAELLEKVVKTKLSSSPNLKAYREQFETLMNDPIIGSDPFGEYVTGMVMLDAGETKLAEQYFTSSIEDYRKFDYPARFAVMAFNQRAKTKPAKMIRYDENELYVDALTCWLQDDFSESPDTHRHCWAILAEAISNLAKADKLDLVKKMIDKNDKDQFITPWISQMVTAQYYIQTGKVAFASDEVIQNATKHLNAALEINSVFPEAQQDLKVVAKLASPGE